MYLNARHLYTSINTLQFFISRQIKLSSNRCSWYDERNKDNYMLQFLSTLTILHIII